MSKHIVHERKIKETKLAEAIYVRCTGDAMFHENSQLDGISPEELTLIASYAFIAAKEFTDLEGMTDEERKKYATTCAARLVAAI
jgi:hypothetical protein